MPNVAFPQKYALPAPTRRGLSRGEAAAYIGVGASKFGAMIIDNQMPAPKKIDGRRVWDMRLIDQFFDDLPGGDVSDLNPWDE